MKKKRILTYNSLHIDEDIYFFDAGINALIKYENNNGKLRYVSPLPTENILGECLISQLVLLGDKIICVPLNAKRIWIYNMISGSWDYIELGFPDVQYKFMKSIVYNETIYMIPTKYPKILVINAEGKILRDLQEIDLDYSGKAIEDMIWFRSDIVVDDNKIYAACCSADFVFKYDLTLKKKEWICLNTDFGGFSGIAFDGSDFWLSPKKREISKALRWNGHDEVNEIHLNTDFQDGSYRGIVYDKGEMIVKRENSSIVINVNNFKSQRKDRAYFVYENFDEKKVVDYDGNYFYLRDGVVRKIELMMDSRYRSDFISSNSGGVKGIFNKSLILQENIEFQLEDYLSVLIKDKKGNYEQIFNGKFD